MAASRPFTRPRVAALAAAALAVAAPQGAVAAAPKVEQMIAFRSGDVVETERRAAATRVRVEGRRCGVAEGTALAALVRSRPGRIELKDFGRCTSRGRDGGGLFVNAIRGERNRGQDGWSYKVGRRAATAGAADPAGPFGRGRLRGGRTHRVTWFYCRLRGGSCQRSLDLRYRFRDELVVFDVVGYDDEGDGTPVAGATVRAAGRTLTTDSRGRASADLAPGGYRFRARKRGLVPSFAERVIVR